MKKLWTWIKTNPNRAMFLVPIILVAGISISHVVTWYDIANPINWAIYLSIAIEVGAMTALVAATNRIKGGVWFMFGIVTLIQMIGNIFYCFKEIDETGELFKSWVELTSPIWDMVSDSSDTISMKRWLAFLEGGLLPIISLTSLHFFVKYDKQEEKKENLLEEKEEETESVKIDEEVKVKVEEEAERARLEEEERVKALEEALDEEAKVKAEEEAERARLEEEERLEEEAKVKAEEEVERARLEEEAKVKAEEEVERARLEEEERLEEEAKVKAEEETERARLEEEAKVKAEEEIERARLEEEERLEEEAKVKAEEEAERARLEEEERLEEEARVKIEEEEDIEEVRQRMLEREHSALEDDSIEEVITKEPKENFEQFVEKKKKKLEEDRKIFIPLLDVFYKSGEIGAGDVMSTYVQFKDSVEQIDSQNTYTDDNIKMFLTLCNYLEITELSDNIRKSKVNYLDAKTIMNKYLSLENSINSNVNNDSKEPKDWWLNKR